MVYRSFSNKTMWSAKTGMTEKIWKELENDEDILQRIVQKFNFLLCQSQMKQDVKKIKKKILMRLNLVGRQSLSLQFQQMLRVGYAQPGLGVGVEKITVVRYTNTRSFGKLSYNFNKENNGVLVEGTWVGDLSGD